jgi:hypothetical protein
VISNIVLLTVIEPPVLAISVFVITVLSVIVLVSPLLVATVLNVTLFLINVLIVMFPLTIVRDLIPLSVNFSTVLLLIVVVVVVLAGIVPVRSTLDKTTGPVRTKLVRGGEQRLMAEVRRESSDDRSDLFGGEVGPGDIRLLWFV